MARKIILFLCVLLGTPIAFSACIQAQEVLYQSERIIIFLEPSQSYHCVQIPTPLSHEQTTEYFLLEHSQTIAFFVVTLILLFIIWFIK